MAIESLRAVPVPALPTEAPGRRVLRRAVTIPVVVLAFALNLALLPVLLLVAAALDVSRPAGRKSQASLRLVLFGVSYFGTETLGLLMLLGVWLSSLGRPAVRAERTFAVQRLYTGLHFAAVKALFRLRFEVQGAELATPGPLLVLVRHLLPPRPGGVLALLDASPACDVLFVGHHGLEGFARIADIWRGALVGHTVTVRLWREAAATIPDGDAARLEWLAARWQRLDDWLDALSAKGG